VNGFSRINFSSSSFEGYILFDFSFLILAVYLAAQLGHLVDVKFISFPQSTHLFIVFNRFVPNVSV
jgi:hypothetical protein